MEHTQRLSRGHVMQAGAATVSRYVAERWEREKRNALSSMKTG